MSSQGELQMGDLHFWRFRHVRSYAHTMDDV